MKTPYLGFLIGALALVGSTPAQTINNGQMVAGLFQMDLTVPPGNWYLQSTPVLPAVTWTTIAGPVLPLTFTDATSGTASQRYYRLVNVPVPTSAANCGNNRYGFIRKTVVPGFCMYADQLIGDSGNILMNILPTLNDQTSFYQYAFGWSIDTWDITFPGWNFGTATLNPGQGCFLENPGPATQVTFIGTVPEGTLVTPLAAGFNMVSSQVPQAGLVTTDLGFTPNDQDVVYQFDCATKTYFLNVYDLSGVGGWDPVEPYISVGESFWINSQTAGSWVRIFNACP
jgi:hypothetical protein